MDMDHPELQTLGFFGIFKQSFHLLSSWRQIFSRIALTILLPFSIVILIQIPTSDGGKYYGGLDRNIAVLIVSNIAFLIIDAALFLLSVSAVVYTAACAYTSKSGMTFSKVMKVVPKVWKRLLLTFFWSFLILLVYHIVAVIILALSIVLVNHATAGVAQVFAFVLLGILLLLYLVGVVYISVVWHLASAVTVLEEPYGMAALRKSRELVKGKLAVASGIFVVFHVFLVGINFAWRIVVQGGVVGLGAKIGIGVVMVPVLAAVILLGLVVLTVVYLVCKTHHQEDVGRTRISDHLDTYLGEHERLGRVRNGNVQMSTTTGAVSV